MHERHQQYLAELSVRADDAVNRHGLQGVRAEVVLVLDTSKSMYSMYKNNMVSELATRLLALSLEFDDDGVIPAYAFGDTCRHLGDLTIKDFPGWVEREVIRTGNDFQSSCKYAPVIHDVCRYFFPEEWDRPTTTETVGRIFKKTQTKYPNLSAPRAYPVYALFVTSGDCEDQEATTDAVRRSSRMPIFWQFIGLQPGKGPATRFKFLEKLDTLGNTYVDNCGFFEATDARDDKLLFEGMCREFPSYLKLPKVQGMLAPEDEGGLRTRGERNVQGQDAGTDTATRMEAFDPEDEDRPLDTARQAERRKAAEARAKSRRDERSRVDVPAHAEVEPTESLPAQKSRLVEAAKDTRTLRALEAAEARVAAKSRQVPAVSEGTGTRQREASRVVKSTQLPPGVVSSSSGGDSAEAMARRERRKRLETQRQALPASLEEAEAVMKKQAAKTVMRAAMDDPDELDGPRQSARTTMRPAIDERAPNPRQSERTVMRAAIDLDGPQEAGTVMRGAFDDDDDVPSAQTESTRIGMAAAEDVQSERTATALVAAPIDDELDDDDAELRAAEAHLAALRARKATKAPAPAAAQKSTAPQLPPKPAKPVLPIPRPPPRR